MLVKCKWLLNFSAISSPPAQEPTRKKSKMTRLLYQVQCFELTCFIGSCHVGVQKRLSRGINLAAYCLSSLICFWLLRSLVDPILGAFIIGGPGTF